MKRKPKISVEECCEEFYDKNIFHAIIAGIDGWSVLLDAYSKSVTEADTSFSSIDPTLFRQEMTAVRMEVFALAFARKVKREDLTLVQSFFTRRYLEENGKLDIWDIMLEYNRAISDSATLTATLERMEDWRVEKSNLAKWEFFKKWWDTNIGGPIDDPSASTEEQKMLAKCVARVANRIGADMRRADCAAAKRLAARLAERLECDINLSYEALFRLAATIFGFYRGAEEYLKSISL